MRESESGGAGTSPNLLGRRSGGREGRGTPLNQVTLPGSAVLFSGVVAPTNEEM